MGGKIAFSVEQETIIFKILDCNLEFWKNCVSFYIEENYLMLTSTPKYNNYDGFKTNHSSDLGFLVLDFLSPKP